MDHRIIDAVSIALNGSVGREDDVKRLRQQVGQGLSSDPTKTACEIAVAFIRWTQDLKAERDGAIAFAARMRATDSDQIARADNLFRATFRENTKLKLSLRDLLQCRDVSWDAGGGHDWKQAVEQAIGALEAV